VPRQLRLAVIGSRSIPSYRFIDEAQRLSGIGLTEVAEIVSSGADGADEWAEWFAYKCGIPLRVIRADWKRFGKRAGYVRNEELINAVDVVLAVWDGKSCGTLHAVRLAEKLGKRVRLFRANVFFSNKELEVLRERVRDGVYLLAHEEPVRLSAECSRVVCGGRGVYVEFSSIEPGLKDWFRVPDGKSTGPRDHSWRLASKTCTYTCGFVEPNGFPIKVYRQRREVGYADYRPGKYYVTPFDLVDRSGEWLLDLTLTPDS